MHNKRKGFQERLNGDLTDPLNLNIVIYSCTYVLSVICSIIPFINQFNSETFEIVALFRALTDCIVPTTATLVLGTIIQNVVSISQAKVKRFALSVWSLLAIFVYMVMYPLFRTMKSSWLDIVVWFVSAGIVVLEMCAVAQVENEKHKNIKSLSG